MNYISTARVVFLGLLASVAPCSSSVAAETKSMSTSPTPSVVILGASYAKGWAPAQLSGLAVVNRGIGGEETSGMLARFQSDVAQQKPRAVVIWGFINDIFRSKGDFQVARDRAYTNTVELIDRAAAAGIVPIVATEVTITTPNTFKEKFMSLIGGVLGKVLYQQRVNGHVRHVNERLRALAKERGLLLLDFEKTLDGDDGLRKREYAVADGSHLSEAAYDALTRHADAVMPATLVRK
jgi:lysophospholipase L1-like esterase